MAKGKKSKTPAQCASQRSRTKANKLRRIDAQLEQELNANPSLRVKRLEEYLQKNSHRLSLQEQTHLNKKLSRCRRNSDTQYSAHISHLEQARKAWA